MADLSQLSDEQLGVYRDLLAKKQGVPGMEQFGGTPPAEAGARPPVPLPLQGKPLGIGARALQNLPGSLMDLPGKLTASTPGMPGEAAHGSITSSGGYRPVDVEGIKTGLVNLWNTAKHPAEAFANDPAGTAVLPLQMFRGGSEIAEAIPNAERAGRNFQTVMGKAKDVPLDLTAASKPALRAMELRDAGSTMPTVLNKFLQRTTAPGLAPLTYEHGRDFASNASRLSANETTRLTPPMKAQVNEFAGALGDANRTAAEQAGVGPLYSDAMNEYRRAMKIKAAKGALGQAANSTLGKVVGGTGLGIGGYFGARALGLGNH